MYQPVRQFRAHSNRSSAAPCCVMFLILTTFVVLGTIFVLMHNNSQNNFLRFDDVEISIAFEKFKLEYDKQYDTVEESIKRKAIFAYNYRRIEEYNAKNDHTILEINKFADMADEEFEQIYLRAGANDKCVVAQELAKKNPLMSFEPRDIDIDWNKKGKVLPIKDQGSCGSCWTFAATSVIETIYAIRENPSQLARFSEQQIVDCCRKEVSAECPVSDGCSGGLSYEGFNYVMNKGHMLFKDYPYHAADEQCAYDPSKPSFKIHGWSDIEVGNVTEMEDVLQNRTFTVGVSAGYYAFRFYKSGVLDVGCPEGPVNHGVTVVGAGTEIINGQNYYYWLVRNSWGKNWGFEGHIKISRYGPQQLGYCGINSCAQYVKYKESM